MSEFLFQNLDELEPLAKQVLPKTVCRTPSLLNQSLPLTCRYIAINDIIANEATLQERGTDYTRQ